MMMQSDDALGDPLDVMMRRIASELRTFTDLVVDLTEPSPEWKSVRVDVRTGRRRARLYQEDGTLVVNPPRSGYVEIPDGTPREIAFFIVGALRA